MCVCVCVCVWCVFVFMHVHVCDSGQVGSVGGEGGAHIGLVGLACLYTQDTRGASTDTHCFPLRKNPATSNTTPFHSPGHYC